MRSPLLYCSQPWPVSTSQTAPGRSPSGAGELGAVGLFPQGAEAGDQGDAGAHHGGELPGEDDEVIVADAAGEEAEGSLAALSDLGDGDREVAHLGDPELDEPLIVGDEGAADKGSGGVSSSVAEGGHGV